MLLLIRLDAREQLGTAKEVVALVEQYLKALDEE